MEIRLNNGKKDVLLRGNDGVYELCELKNVKDAEKKVVPTWTPVAWYCSIQSALSRVAEIKLSNSDATTLAELQNEVVRVRKEIVSAYEI